MFIISQYLLNLSGTCKNVNQISTYSIITGLILYASIYLYLLFYNDEYLSIFNKFLIYIIVVDLLLSTFYYFNLQKSYKYDNSLSINEFKQQQQEDLESVDMSLVDNESDISDTQSEEHYEQEETEIEEELEEELETELEEEHKQESEQPEYPEHLIKEEPHEQHLEEQHLEEQLEQPREEQLCDKQLDLDLDEIDALLSIPVPSDETETPKKVKAKRQPRKKKESVVI
jgi:outer membrane biosynthesis protein TonB